MDDYNSKIDQFAYMMAAEKMVTMISLMEQNLEFFEDYNIIPDEEVKKALLPVLDKMREWIK